ncbi:MAG: hypothetical protein JOZ15_14795 [Acidobacteria bacterium]|nr:hypothetical protein [Acidobacteriota bacterium]
MSPPSFPRTPRAARRWLAVAMMMPAVWSTAMPARFDVPPGTARLAVALRAHPTLPWLPPLWTGLAWAGSAPQLHAARAAQPPAAGRHGAGIAAPTGSDTGSGGSNCTADPNGCHPGP